MTPADLRVFRARHKLSQPKLAARLGVTTSTINRWENEHAPMPPMLALALKGLAVELGEEEQCLKPCCD